MTMGKIWNRLQEPVESVLASSQSSAGQNPRQPDLISKLVLTPKPACSEQRVRPETSEVLN